jgi:hypothetical protein
VVVVVPALQAICSHSRRGESHDQEHQGQEHQEPSRQHRRHRSLELPAEHAYVDFGSKNPRCKSRTRLRCRTHGCVASPGGSFIHGSEREIAFDDGKNLRGFDEELISHISAARESFGRRRAPVPRGKLAHGCSSLFCSFKFKLKLHGSGHLLIRVL